MTASHVFHRRPGQVARHGVRFAAGAAVAGGAAALAIGAAGTANAELTGTVVDMDQACTGLSPYIVDQPFAFSQVDVLQDSEKPGGAWVNITPSSLWSLAGGYDSDYTLDWTNIDTGATGQAQGTQHATNPGGGDSWGTRVDTGPGDVEVTVSAFNHHGLWGFPSTSCTGSFHVD